jgi:hypothetical protein
VWSYDGLGGNVLSRLPVSVVLTVRVVSMGLVYRWRTSGLWIRRSCGVHAAVFVSLQSVLLFFEVSANAAATGCAGGPCASAAGSVVVQALIVLLRVASVASMTSMTMAPVHEDMHQWARS